MKVLIVDDEQPARDRLRQIIEDMEGYAVAGEAGNGQQALQLAAEMLPDVVLLDIRMPGLNGIETAHHLNTMSSPPAVVFTTAYDEYAIEAFDARAIGYVLKPVRRARLEKALGHAARISPAAISEVGALAELDTRRQHVCARVQDQLKLIPVDTVLYFQADQKYVNVNHLGGQDLIDDSLKSLEQEFGDVFVRIHRSALVAVAHISRLDKTGTGQHLVVLRTETGNDGDDLIVSRRHVADVRRRLKGR